MQNAIGIGMASLLGLDPLMGLLAGSITLSGGHGTGAAWSKLFIERYGFHQRDRSGDGLCNVWSGAGRLDWRSGGTLSGETLHHTERYFRMTRKFRLRSKSRMWAA
ncbi:sodium/glutamate symport carrier protein (glutamate permease) [Escherichia coli]|uniref:Sodium/glutamate symport carrier protein (Glutamate permease) n=1 Tax=Escherichia coli TaxID=562 RepID=A0A376LE92_ECOLX|nr:sodium/glutamate symport carrier protein (glutamate permease) [Escherichia coli]